MSYLYGGPNDYSSGAWLYRLLTAADNEAKYQTNAGTKYAISGEATLWGKAIPITWGRRRITGQLLQIGITGIKTTVTDLKNVKQPGTVFPTPGGSVTMDQIGVGYEIATSYQSTFAYCFGAPGNRSSKQILRKMWINGQLAFDIEQGALSNNFRFRFYQGNEDQLPDSELNRDRYDFPVAYRGLMYIVFYDYVSPQSAGMGNPVIEAEFAEEVTNTQPIRVYETMGETITATFHPDSLTFDAKKGIAYSVGNDGQIYKFRVADGALLDVYPITGWTDPPGSGESYASGAWANTRVFFRLNGVPVLGATLGGGNSQRFHLINADSGVVITGFGANGTSLTPSLSNLCHIVSMNATVLNDPSFGSKAQIVLADLFNCSYLLEFNGSEITAVAFYHKPGLGISGAMGAPKNGSVVDVYQWYTTSIWKNGVDFYTAPYSVIGGFYCGLDNTIVFVGGSGSNWFATKIKPDGTVVWSIDQDDVSNIGIPNTSSAPQWQNNSNTAGGQRIGWVSNGSGLDIAILDMISGVVDKVTRLNAGGTGSRIFDAFSNRFIFVTSSPSTSLSDYPLFQQTVGDITLATFLSNVAELQGYEPGNITVSGIDDQIVGAVITEVTDLDAMLSDISKAYNFQIIKTGRTIKFTRRGYGSGFLVDAEYTEEQRAILSDGDGEYVTVETEIQASNQTPGSIRLRYVDPDYQFTVNEFTYKRNDPLADPTIEMSLALPIIMNGSTAAALAARALVDAGVNATTHSFRLPQARLAHEPGDVVDLVFDDYSDTVRMIEISYNGDFSLTIKSEAILTNDGPTYPIEAPVLPEPPAPELQGEGEPLVFDTTLLFPYLQLDADALEIWASAVAAGRLPLRGGNIISKSVDGKELQPKGDVDQLVYGSVVGKLPNGPYWAFNMDQEIKIRLLQGDPTKFESRTMVEVLAGANRLLVGDTTRWEHIGFCDVDYDDTTKTLTLSNIIRGLRGTEPYGPLHQSADYAVLIENETFLPMFDNVSDLNKTAVYAVSTELMQVNYADAVTVQILGQARRPWAPARVQAEDVSGDVVLTWERRTRLYGTLHDGSGSVPLDEASEAYQLTLYRAGNAVRTVDLTSPTFTYTSSMQSTDGWVGSITDLQLTVSQVSELVGPGFVNSGTYHVE